MKIKYNPTRWISTADLLIACDPPIKFEVVNHLPKEWRRVAYAWEKDGSNNPDTALQLIAEAFISVAQDDEKWAINSRDDAEALRYAVDESSPGSGDDFICDLLAAFKEDYYLFLAENSMAFGRLSPPSNGIAESVEPATAKAA